MNVFDDNWGEQPEDWSGGGALQRRLFDTGVFLGATLYELGRGNFVIYHAHHGSDELLLVLDGAPTLRTPAGETALTRGDVVHFPPGPDGAHGLRNDAAEPARYVMFGTRVSPEVVEYPDLRQVTAQSRHGVFLIHDLETPPPESPAARPRANAFEPGGWEDWGEIPPGWCTKGFRLVRPRDAGVTASVYVVEPGEKQVPYHFHHGTEEILVVLEGSPTLRTPEGERTLAPGDLVRFPPGPEGAHQVRNDDDTTARVVVVDAPASPDVVEYPDSGKIGAVARTPLFSLHFKHDTADYWAGEVDLRAGE